jgi:hypothetical protein
VRSSRHSLRCAHCPARITLEIEYATWIEPAKDWTVAMGHKLGWQVGDEVACPVHRSPP